MSAAISFNPLDISPQAGLAEIDPGLRLNEFLNNPRPVGKIPPQQLSQFVLEQGIGESEREMFVALGKLIPENVGHKRVSERETLTMSETSYGDPTYSIIRKPYYEHGATRVTNIIAVEGLFLFGHSHQARAMRSGKICETEASPLRPNEYRRFGYIADTVIAAANHTS